VVPGRALNASQSRPGPGDRGSDGAHRRWRHIRSLFAGVRFDEVDKDILFVYAKDEETASEMEDTFVLHISIIATDILKREVGIVMVLPKQLAQ
jgi:hypothetical protein